MGKRTMTRSPQDTPRNASPTPRNRGVGMLIITAYGIFAVSSFARALYQILTDFDASPVSYTLSAFAAGVYIVATIALAASVRAPGCSRWSRCWLS